jgi:hypothetical protein
MITPPVVYVIEYRRRGAQYKNWHIDFITHDITFEKAGEWAWNLHKNDPRYDFRAIAYERIAPASW